MNNHIVGLGHVALRCRDVEQSLAFYTGVLGFEHLFTLTREETGKPWLAYLRVAQYQYVELFYEGYEGDNAPGIHSHHHTCFMTEDARALGNELQRKGVKLYAGPTFLERPYSEPYVPVHARCGCYCFYIRDPDGNEVEFMQFTSESLQPRYDHA